MDASSSQDLVAILATVGGVALTSALGAFAVRRARASRRRQIEAADEPRPEVTAGPRRTIELDDPARPGADDDEAVAAGGTEPAPKTRARDAQILPFPAGPTGRPASGQQPVKPGDVLGPGLAKTRAGWVSRLGQLFSGRRQIDPTLLEELEKVLLTADIGVRTSQKLLTELRESLSRKELGDSEAAWNFLRRRCREILSVAVQPLDLTAGKPFVLLIIGVNGSGKTTTIGKLAAQLRAQGKTVILAAGDTFRAAATEQLEIWGGRVGVPVVRGKEGGDPSSVIFEAIKRAKTEGIDVVIADTAGRLHTKSDLMEELQKVRRVIAKAETGAPHETFLVIDSTSGQNAIAQAQIFTAAMSVSGIVLTKLDGTAKGGVILGIADQLAIPVRYVGVGERVEDLRAFDAEEFVSALFDGVSPASAA
jgi:fused signal recognition particle receptor